MFKPGSLILHDTEWHLEVYARGDADGDKGSSFMYGHSEVYTGRLTFTNGSEEYEDEKGKKHLRRIVDEVLMKTARDLLPGGRG
ncbi:hypothetical protein ACE1OC_34020 [Streptomyces sp. DSM 116496]|uniref:hypothetical protein n=1 Tax=Streptomyces stoeckheimensis TaxID=3344656 RepID=UPI0038B33596